MTIQGTVLAGRYAVGELLGRGGMAEVYLGTDRVLDRPVAIKVLGSWLANDATFVERFRREALAAARVSHPNLVAVYDAGSEDAVHYIVMEHVPGETLADAIRRDGPIDPSRAGRLTRSVVDALGVAHAAGIVHRDVKPANVMLTPDGGAKLMDLGIARSLGGETLTRASSVLGTAGYVSPEQARGERVDSRSDIYSLGCVLYEMLTGRPPFQADNPVAVAYRHVHEAPLPPSSVEPAVPPAMDAVVLRAMAKDPEDRFATVEELAAAMEGDTVPVPALGPTAPLPVVVSEPRVPRRADRTPRRRRSALVLGLAGLALLGGLVWALLANGGAARRPGAVDSPSRSSPSGSPSASPATVPGDPIETAAESLLTLVQQGVSEGRIDEHVADEIRKRVGEILEKVQEGDTEKAFDALDELKHKVEEAVDHRDIEPPVKQKIEKAIAELETQIRVAAGGD